MKITAVNIISTILFNFKFLPFKQAIYLPIVLYHKIRIIRNTGRILIKTDDVKFQMVQIGAHGFDMFCNQTTTIDIGGEIIIRGDGVRVGHGSLLRVEEKGCIEFHKNSIIGAKNLVFCKKNITFRENSLFSWDCQIMDTDTHALKDVVTGEIKDMSCGIDIGDNSWIGNHVIINKGTRIPSGTIVSSYSLCNKDYAKIIANNSLIGGVPAKLLKRNIERIS